MIALYPSRGVLIVFKIKKDRSLISSIPEKSCILHMQNCTECTYIYYVCFFFFFWLVLLVLLFPFLASVGIQYICMFVSHVSRLLLHGHALSPQKLGPHNFLHFLPAGKLDIERMGGSGPFFSSLFFLQECVFHHFITNPFSCLTLNHLCGGRSYIYARDPSSVITGFAYA